MICPFCKYEHELDDRYGCPNCNAEETQPEREMPFISKDTLNTVKENMTKTQLAQEIVQKLMNSDSPIPADNWQVKKQMKRTKAELEYYHSKFCT